MDRGEHGPPDAVRAGLLRDPDRRAAVSAPVAVGSADTGALALDRAPDGRAVLALDRQVDATHAVPEAAIRPPDGAFDLPRPLADPQRVPAAYGPSAAIDDRGAVTVGWSSSPPPPGAAAAPAGVFLAREVGADLAAPAALSPEGRGRRHPVLAASGDRTLAAWSTGAGAFVAVAG